MLNGDFFETYLDESGTHDGSPILTVGCYLGTHRQWDVFLERWQYSEFHAKNPRFERLKNELADAIDASGIAGYEVCIRPWEFEATASAAFKSHLGNGYAAAVVICVIGICELVMKVNPNARIAFILEHGQPNVLWVQKSLIALMAECPIIANVTVVFKKEFRQLHPADFLAHSRSTTNKVWLDRLFEKGRVWENPLDGEIFQQTSEYVTDLLQKHRRNKARERRARTRD